MKKEKPIKTETGIYTKAATNGEVDFFIYDKHGKVVANIEINNWALKVEECLELEEIILSIGEKPGGNK